MTIATLWACKYERGRSELPSGPNPHNYDDILTRRHLGAWEDPGTSLFTQIHVHLGAGKGS